MELFSTHTIDLFKIPDVNQWLKRRHAVPVFQTIFYYVFDLVRNRCQFPCRRTDFILRTYFVRPKTCYCQQQSSQYPIFPSQARDQSLIRVARILDAADFASRENCSFIRLNDAPRKTLLKPAKKTLRQPTLSTAAYSVNSRYKLAK